jgi:hypothetical protein
MAITNQYTTPAERDSGCTLVLPGGIYNGSSYDEFDLQGNEFESDEITIVSEFVPYFNWDEDVTRYLYDSSTGSDRYLMYKRDSAGSNTIDVYCGNVQVASIPSANYSAYWRQNCRNVFCVVSKTGDNDFYLNGNLIYQTSTAWTFKKPTRFVIAARYATPFLYFYGEIFFVKIFNRLLTVEEIADIQENRTYNYRNEATLDLPMTDQLHSPPYSLDVSRSGRNITWVGSPTKLSNQCGYELNGSTQYGTIDTAGLLNQPELSFIMRFSPYFLPDIDAYKFFWDTGVVSGHRYALRKAPDSLSNVLQLSCGDISVNIPYTSYQHLWRYKARNELIVSVKDGLTEIFFNKKNVLSYVSSYSHFDFSLLYFWCHYSTTLYHIHGIIHSFAIVPRVITPTQVADINTWSYSDDL